jgi:hypothetical protein
MHHDGSSYKQRMNRLMETPVDAKDELYDHSHGNLEVEIENGTRNGDTHIISRRHCQLRRL